MIWSTDSDKSSGPAATCVRVKGFARPSVPADGSSSNDGGASGPSSRSSSSASLDDASACSACSARRSRAALVLAFSDPICRPDPGLRSVRSLLSPGVLDVTRFFFSLGASASAVTAVVRRLRWLPSRFCPGMPDVLRVNFAFATGLPATPGMPCVAPSVLKRPPCDASCLCASLLLNSGR